MFSRSVIKIFDYLEHRHEISFIFEGKEYNFLNQLYDDVIQLEIWVENDNKFYEDICIASEKSKSAFFIDDECIERLFEVKCFNGKSFLEIENLIQVLEIL
jgi:hypothetical protein